MPVGSGEIETHIDFVDFHVNIVRNKDLSGVDHVLGVESTVGQSLPLGVCSDVAEGKSARHKKAQSCLHVCGTASVADRLSASE